MPIRNPRLNLDPNQSNSLDIAQLEKRLSALERTTGSTGKEMAYAERTTIATSTSTTEAGGTTTLSATFTADGLSTYYVEVFAPQVQHSTAGTNVLVSLLDGATGLGYVRGGTDINGNSGQLRLMRRVVFSAGSHTLNAVLWASAAGTSTWVAGAGGASTLLPSFIRVTKAS